jgi:hypothetical protein
MGFADQFFGKQKGFSPQISDHPAENLRFAVVIPAYCEPDITSTLNALWNCQRPLDAAEVIIVVNAAEDAGSAVINCNKSTTSLIRQWIAGHHDPVLRFYVIEKLNMPARHAGVGLARKTGMDEALYRFNLINHARGFILSFDADSTCDSNYFTAIADMINKKPDTNGFTIYFEHPVSGPDFPEKVYRGIIDYELHLRYVNQFLRFTAFPFAYHTVGSCFGVRADTYAGQGGMNKKKAGEDFYFLHKIIPLGHFVDICTTRVIPSPRESNRVPFGTGSAVSKYLASETDQILTYAPECFLTLKTFFQQIDKFYNSTADDMKDIIEKFPVPLKSYLVEMHIVDAVAEINANCSTFHSFQNRFFRWFDAFRIVKYLNYASRGFYKQLPVKTAVTQFLSVAGYEIPPETVSSLELLMILRQLDKGSKN